MKSSANPANRQRQQQTPLATGRISLSIPSPSGAFRSTAGAAGGAAGATGGASAAAGSDGVLGSDQDPAERATLHETKKAIDHLKSVTGIYYYYMLCCRRCLLSLLLLCNSVPYIGNSLLTPADSYSNNVACLHKLLRYYSSFPFGGKRRQQSAQPLLFNISCVTYTNSFTLFLSLSILLYGPSASAHYVCCYSYLHIPPLCGS